MTRNKTGRLGWHQATRNTSAACTAKFNAPAARIKAAIVTLALWGLLPIPVAVWLIKRGGLRNV